jgi:hypothetical protein
VALLSGGALLLLWGKQANFWPRPSIAAALVTHLERTVASVKSLHGIFAARKGANISGYFQPTHTIS